MDELTIKHRPDGDAGERTAARSSSAPGQAFRTTALASLHRDHWRDLCRYLAASFGQGPPEPEDIAQLAFARVAAHEDFRSIENPKAFLWRVAQNIALSEKRSQAVRDRRPQEIDGLPLGSRDEEVTPERVLVAKQQIAVIAAALDAMPAKRRRMLVLNRIEGLSFAEIARRTSLSQTAVKKHVARAMIDLDAILAEQ
ncbi:RNA polymerase sigma factor [Algihabitans albus]|uniref:RNA polymerase sigma factor n=1 Tax=Algihabitans albus TaxID=2164067 RepID=UPI0013C35F78|nr:RNA polymerase sigma factor [Algihabitans albus]